MKVEIPWEAVMLETTVRHGARPLMYWSVSMVIADVPVAETRIFPSE